MKNNHFSGVASCVITIKKACQSILPPRMARGLGGYPLLYIYYFFNVNNDALTQRPICRGFKRGIICDVLDFQKGRRIQRLLARVIRCALFQGLVFSTLWIFSTSLCPLVANPIALLVNPV